MTPTTVTLSSKGQLSLPKEIREPDHMRRTITLTLATLVLAFAAATRAADTAYSLAVNADNPMIYYRFEEGAGATEAEDSSSGSNTGTYNEVTLGGSELQFYPRHCR